MVFEHVQDAKAGFHAIIDLVVVGLARSSAIVVESDELFIVAEVDRGLFDALGGFFNFVDVADDFLFGVGLFLLVGAPFEFDFAFYDKAIGLG